MSCSRPSSGLERAEDHRLVLSDKHADHWPPADDSLGDLAAGIEPSTGAMTVSGKPRASMPPA